MGTYLRLSSGAVCPDPHARLCKDSFKFILIVITRVDTEFLECDLDFEKSKHLRLEQSQQPLRNSTQDASSQAVQAISQAHGAILHGLGLS